MEVRVLGPLEVRRARRPVKLGGPRQRALLAALLLRRNSAVAFDELLEAVWGEALPRTAAAALLNQVSALRRILGDAVVTAPPGYLLRVDDDVVDLARFERLRRQAAGEPTPARAATLAGALRLWRGRAFADVTLHGPFEVDVAAVDDLRLSVLEERIAADLELGRHDELISELETLVARHPLRERFLEQLMVALYRAGRQADALAVYRAARARLIEELGLEPAEALRRLERAILVHESALASKTRQEIPLSVLQRALELTPGNYREKADFAFRLGVALWRLGEADHARDALEEARERAALASARDIEIRAEVELRTQAVYRGEERAADHVVYLQRAIRDLRRLHDDLGLALALLVYANMRRDLGNVHASLAAYARAAAHGRRAVGESWPTGLILAIEGYTLPIGPTHTEDAIRRCDEILHSVDWGPPGPVGVYSGLGVLYAMRGDGDTASAFVSRAWAAVKEYDLQPIGAGAITHHAAWVEELGGRYEAAAELLGRGVAVLRRLDIRGGIAPVAAQRARMLARLGQVDDALADAALALELSDGDDILAECEARRARGLALSLRGRHAAAAAAARDAVARADASDYLPLRAGARADLAEVLMAAGQAGKGRAAARRAVALHERKGNVVAAARARALVSAS